MSPAAQRYEVSQIFAEAESCGIPLRIACLCVARWFDVNGLTPPVSIKAWLAEVPREFWRPDRLH